MTFSSFTRDEKENLVAFESDGPLTNVSSLNFYMDDAEGYFRSREVRWSLDGENWSAWSILRQSTVSDIRVPSGQVYLQLRYRPAGGAVRSVEVDYNPLETPEEW